MLKLEKPLMNQEIGVVWINFLGLFIDFKGSIKLALLAKNLKKKKIS